MPDGDIFRMQQNNSKERSRDFMRNVSERDYNGGSAFQPGAKGNEIVLVLESPGAEELEEASPLSGPTLLSYDCIRAIISLSNRYPLALAMSKTRVRIVNVWPDKINKTERTRLIKEFERGQRNKAVEIIGRKISDMSTVVCFGELACVVYNKVMQFGIDVAKTVVYAPYFGEQGLAEIEMPLLNKKRNKSLRKLELMGLFLSRCLLSVGRFGWKDIKQIWKEKTGEDIGWNKSDDGPNWMNPCSDQML